MKRTTICFTILFSTVLFISSCKKATNTCSLIHAKVLRYDCDRVILQIMDNSIASDADWEDVMTGNHYSNVVSYHNTCAFAFGTNNIVQDVYLEGARTVVNAFRPADCVQCQAVSPNPPQTKIDVTRISLTPCENKN